MTTWSSDDRRVVTAVSDYSLCVWDSATCQLLTRLKGHQVSLAFHFAANSVAEPHHFYAAPALNLKKNN
jgi:WD40 repeat protein